MFCNNYYLNITFLCIYLFLCNSVVAANLWPGGKMVMGHSLFSDNGKYFLTVQDDGNTVMYRKSDMAVRWNAGTQNSISYAIMQTDGNFVVYDWNNHAKWNSGTAGNPNSFLSVQDDGNLVIYNGAKPLWNIGADIDSRRDPSSPGDVVGRDLDVSGVGFLGHVGIFDGDNVIEALNEGSNSIHINSLENFKSKTTYWGTAFPKIPNGNAYYCFAEHCTNFLLKPQGQVEKISNRLAITRRARQAYLIGATYTLSPDYKSAWAGDYSHLPLRGKYRCDTFVFDILMITSSLTNYNNNYHEPIDNKWDKKLSSLIEFGAVHLPRVFFDKIKNF